MAKAYCTWRGARLPTEAEWEKAARGTNASLYPWDGNDLACQNANYQRCVNRTDKVGSYEAGKSPYNVYDMAGNVWEWVADWYSESYYQNSLSNNPMGPNSGKSRVLRGGSWTQYDVRVTNRNRYAHDYTSFDIGIRCVADPPK
jgi:formylglycine-generating enzyme required for sulfatase activity